MRFCLVTTFYPPYHFGGDATYVRSLAQALSQRGHDVEIIHCLDAYALKQGYQELSVPEEAGIVIHRLRSHWGMLSPLITQQTGHPGLKTNRIRTILEQDFDVIHFHNISLVGGPAILRMGHALVKLLTIHEHWLLCPTHIFWKNSQQVCDQPQCVRCCLRSGIPPQWWRYTPLLNRSLAAVDRILAPSQYTADRHRQAGLGQRIQVLPLFSALVPDHPPADIPSHSPKFLFVGRITAAKGIVDLLVLFAQLPEYGLDVVGEGELRSQLQQDYASHANIRFWGAISQDQLSSFYQQATALVFPSLVPETFGLTIVEAFANGTPVIAHHSGGSSELIRQSGAGFLYQTPAELQAALASLAHHPDRRHQLSQRAYTSYCRHYTREIHLRAYLDLIHCIQQEKGKI